MIRRIIYLAALACIGIATVALQFDRQAALDPQFARITPEPARAFAQAVVATKAVGSGEAGTALHEARTLVARRPMPAESLRVLAQAQLRAGDGEKALTTLQLGAQRGWRDPASQEAMMRLALAAGDREEATRRFLALLVLDGTSEELLQSSATVVFNAGDRRAETLASEILALSERWHDRFLQKGSRVIPPEAFARVVAAAALAGAQFECAPLGQTAKTIGARNRSAARTLDEIECDDGMS